MPTSGHSPRRCAARRLGATPAPPRPRTSRIGLQEDPDVLDPDQSRTFVGRIVYASLCDKLVDITPDLEIMPMLATGWAWSDDGLALTMTLREDVMFHDGTPFNAEAVSLNIDRVQEPAGEPPQVRGRLDRATVEVDRSRPGRCSPDRARRARCSRSSPTAPA